LKILDVTPRFSAAPDRGSDARIHGILGQLARRHEVRQFSQATWGDLRRQPRSRFVEHGPSWLQWQWVHPLAALVGDVPVRAWPTAPLWAGRALALTRPRRLDAWLRWADVVLVEFPWQLGYCQRRHPQGRYVYASMNVELQKFESWARAAGVAPGGAAGVGSGGAAGGGSGSEPGRGGAGERWLRWIERLEAHAVGSAERVVAVSRPDAELFVTRYGCPREKLAVVPNGADTTWIQPASAAARAAARRELGLPEGRPTVLFAGSDVPSNRAGLAWLERVASCAPEITFLAVGQVSARTRARVGGADNLVALGLVADFRLPLAAADLSLVPIEHGGGTKIKILEALAAGLPTLAFPDCLADLELPVVPIEKDARAIAVALRALVSDPDRARRLAADGRKGVVERYDWEVVTAVLEEVLAGLVGPEATVPEAPDGRHGQGS